jgi:hypothetical protein
LVEYTVEVVNSTGVVDCWTGVLDGDWDDGRIDDDVLAGGPSFVVEFDVSIDAVAVDDAAVST